VLIARTSTVGATKRAPAALSPPSVITIQGTSWAPTLTLVDAIAAQQLLSPLARSALETPLIPKWSRSG
jgi:hypothetical protein